MSDPELNAKTAQRLSTILGALFGAMLATSLLGAALPIVRSIASHMFDSSAANALVPSYDVMLALWGASFGAFASRAQALGRSPRALWWSAILVAMPVMLVTIVTAMMVVESSEHRGQWWPIDSIIEAIVGLGAGLVVMAVTCVGALVCVPLVLFAAKRLTRVAPQSVLRPAVFAICGVAILKVVIDTSITSVVIVLVLSITLAVVVLRERRPLLAIFPVTIVGLHFVSFGVHRSIQEQWEAEQQAPYDAPCCYTSQDSGDHVVRGAYALAAEHVNGVAHARAFYRDGYYGPTNGLPLVNVAIELTDGANQAATQRAVRSALATVSCSTGSDSGGVPGMTASVFIGHAIPLDLTVVAEAEPDADLDALERAIRTQCEASLERVPETFALAESAYGLSVPSVDALAVPGVHSLSWNGSVSSNEATFLHLHLAPGDHAVIGHIVMTRALPE